MTTRKNPRVKEIKREIVNKELANVEKNPSEVMPYADFEDAKAHLDGKTKWYINSVLDIDSKQIKNDNGYFGDYTCITYFGKQAIVYVDDRNAKVVFKTPFYDKIFYGANYGMRWDADKRWHNGSPIIVICDNGLYNVITEENGGAPICNKWYKKINTEKERYYGANGQSKNYKYVYAAIDQNDEIVYLSADGGYLVKNNSEELKRVRNMSRDEILEKWINVGGLVVGGCGWQYRGAGTHIIDNKKAAQEFYKYHFGEGFYVLEWVEYNGEVALSMREYSVLDME